MQERRVGEVPVKDNNSFGHSYKVLNEAASCVRLGEHRRQPLVSW